MYVSMEKVCVTIHSCTCLSFNKCIILSNVFGLSPLYYPVKKKVKQPRRYLRPGELWINYTY